jgi:hypothetical protein
MDGYTNTHIALNGGKRGSADLKHIADFKYYKNEHNIPEIPTRI